MCERALEIDPEFALAWSNLANVLQAYERWDKVVEYSARAIELQSDLPEAYEQLAGALLHEKRPTDATQAYLRLLALEPEKKGLPGSVRNARNIACDWQDYTRECAAIARSTRAGKFVAQPFNFLSMSDSAMLHRACVENFVRDAIPTQWNQTVEFPAAD